MAYYKGKKLLNKNNILILFNYISYMKYCFIFMLNNYLHIDIYYKISSFISDFYYILLFLIYLFLIKLLYSYIYVYILIRYYI